jgi:predicted nucleic-acid-binding protein
MRVAVDTNIALRLLIDDGTAQRAAADRLAREHHLVIVPTVLLETEWVLRSVMRLSREAIVAGFEKLLGLTTATFLQLDEVTSAIDAFRSGCDFADALHAALAENVEAFATLDREFARRAGSFPFPAPVRLLPLSGPFSA